ncbi:MAG: GH3 auxin-responsive promoter family protein [Bacteroidales bacterium]|nr:GH3 auxin-responsive promoter family protein [Bacteroidales bacterium]
MSLINKLILSAYAGRYRQFDRMATDGPAIQSNQLDALIRQGSKTKIGAEMGLRPGMGYSDFNRQVPVGDYETLRPYVERILEGETDVTWPGRVRWFAKSSGTSGSKSKFIPVTDDILAHGHMRGNHDVIATYFRQHPDNKVWRGKCLTLGGSKKLTSVGSGIQTGDLSAIMIGNAPAWSGLFRSPKKSIALIAGWEEKLEKITRATAGQNITSLAGVPSWFLVLLKYIMEKQGAKTIQEVWPNLELFIHGGINFGPYREQYKALAPGGINFLETYNASEGFFALQDDPADAGMKLMLDYGVFFEFVPLDEVGQAHPAGIVPLEGVATGVDYAMVITTNGGLWRYMIGDTVRFTQTKPWKIVISGRTKLYINAFGEELMISNAEAAMSRACQETGAVVKEYTAAPVFMDQHTRGCHEWLVEFDKQPSSLEAFRTALDTALQSVNSDYEAKRYKDITLAPLRLTVAKEGLFDCWLSAHDKMGGQNKVPRLHNDRKLIDELLELNH